MEGKYEFYDEDNWNNFDTYIILDDVVTRGSTMKEIRRAIREEVGDVKFYGLTLGKVEYKQDSKKYGQFLDNSHITDVNTIL